MTGKYMPLKTGEATQMQLLIGLIDTLDDGQEMLEKRLKRCGRWRQYRVMQTWTKLMAHDLLETMEPRKKALFWANLRNQVLHVASRGSVSAMPDMTVCRAEDLHWLIDDAVREHCAICMGLGTDMAKCELRKHLKRMALFEPDESGGVCMGKQIEAEG